MKTKEILTSGLTGTTFMTLFSYLVSLADGENFSEPERLRQLAGRLVPKLDKQQSQALGWLGHYGVGLLFALVYVELWRRGKLKPHLKTNLWPGGHSGLLAVAVWKTTFKGTRYRHHSVLTNITCSLCLHTSSLRSLPGSAIKSLKK